MTLMRSHASALLLCLTVLPAVADEALLPDGRRFQGTLSQDGDRWLFLPDVGKDVLPMSGIKQVRFKAAPAAPLHAVLPLRAILRDGSQITGGLRELDGKNLVLETPWAGRLSIPRSALTALRQPPGWLLVRGDDFHRPPADWKSAGKLIFDDSGMSLDSPGQSLTLYLRKGCKEGRAAVTIRAGENSAGSVRVAEAEFTAGKQTRRLTVRLSGQEAPRVQVEGLAGEPSSGPRLANGRLVVQFSPGSLRVLIDDQVLWHSLKQGPGGPLVRWRFACLPQPGRTTAGRVAFSAFSLHRAVDEPRRPDGDPAQDEVWLASGDQLFGRVLEASREGITCEGRFGSRTLPWLKARGVFFRQQPAPEPIPGVVRLSFDNGFDAVHDVIVGALGTLTPGKLSLRHRDLGELSLERGRLRRLDRD